jgi:hypothetical protein
MMSTSVKYFVSVWVDGFQAGDLISHVGIFPKA